MDEPGDEARMPNPTCCSERILVVEDDRDLCGLLSTLLDVEGYRTAVACPARRHSAQHGACDKKPATPRQHLI